MDMTTEDERIMEEEFQAWDKERDKKADAKAAFKAGFSAALDRLEKMEENI